jgi:hypothetical protein
MAAGVGFQGRLKDLPSVVSRYEEVPDKFTVARQPLTYPVLNKALQYSPKVEYGTFASNSLTLNTNVYRDVSLVPISIEGRRYVARRTEAATEQSRRDLFRRTLKEAREGKKREGLNIGVNLPPKFDQMFGEGGANLRVSGYRRITFSGRSQWTDNAGSGVVKPSKFPSLNMEQISRFDITGTIGTKITVKVSQDNQTDIPLANRILLRYKGDEDDILQTIEAGNTTLSIPNTEFVGYSSHIQGLFGLKAEAKLGNLKLTTIASQEKGSSESASVSATGTENKTTIRDFQYVQNRIFDLGYPGWFSPYDTVLECHAYQSMSTTEGIANRRDAAFFIDPRLPDDSSYYASGYVAEIESGFQLWYVGDSARCPFAIVFDNEQNKFPLGIYLVVSRRNADRLQLSVDTIGSLSGDKNTLMMLHPETSRFLPDHPTWDLMWRNCYRMPRVESASDLDLRIMKGKTGAEGTTSSTEYQTFESQSEGPYLKILGLDQINSQDLRLSDGKLDDLPSVFRPDWGLLFFPSREPFNSDTVFVDRDNKETKPLRDTVPEIYSYTSQIKANEASKYYIELSNQTRESIIRLNRANVIEGSERVTANGRVLEKGKDYSIQYDFGQVQLLSEEALDPNADIKVEFQYEPYLAMQKKTLLGARAEYEWSEDLKFGSTILYKSDKAQDRKPRIGQETARAMVLDFDIGFTLHPNFLTKAVDALPLVSTESDSRLGVSGEIAQSRPNPNVEGVAYLDDFEAAVEEVSLGMARNNWTASSMPVPIAERPTTERWVRGAMRWHNPGVISRLDVYDGETEGSLQPLRLIFRPRPFVSSIVDGECTGDSIPTRSWGGIMRYFSNRVDAERVQLFEVRARGGKGQLHFDFGYISEDVNDNGNRDTEDKSYPENNTLDKGEDTGLDHVANTDEKDRCGRSYDADSLPDPSGDNWWYNGTTGDSTNSPRPPVPAAAWADPTFRNNVADPNHYLHYEWQNGTEGNWRDDAVVGIPDDEALIPGATSINTDNAYFSVTMPLSPDASNPFLVPGSEKNGWLTYRVPIREPGVVDTFSSGQYTPGWEKVTYVRVWFEQDSTIEDGIDSLVNMDSVWIANWGFIQSNWKDTLLQSNPLDTVADFYVASVSEDNGTFVPPPGVEAYRDKVTNTTESQRGLALIYDSLPPGDTAVTTKDLLSAESYAGYRRLQMYVHGPDSLASDSIMLFLRFGADSLNYYQYQVLLEAGWTDNNAIDIDFNEITALKDAADRARKSNTEKIDTTDGHYRVVGKPNINLVSNLSIGLVNIGSDRASGEVWVDELRVTDVRRDVGTAARVAVTGSLADLVSYGVNYSHQDPYFRGLSATTRGGSSDNLGSGSESNSLGYNARMNVDKFLPRSWGASLPVAFSYTNTEKIPLLRANSDVILPDSIRELEKNTTTVYRMNVSESFNRKGSNPLFSALLNRQKMSVSYSRTYSKTVTSPYVFGETYTIRGEYEMGIQRDLSVPVFFWTRPLPLIKRAVDSRLSFFPARWKWTADYARNLNVKDDQDLNRSSSFSRQFTGSTDIDYAIFPSLTTSFSMTTKRNLSDPSLVRLSFSNPKLGVEENYQQSFRTSYDPKMFKFLSGSLSYQTSYQNSYDRSTKTLTTDLTRTWSVGGDFRHLELLGAKSGGSSGGAARPRRGGVDAAKDEKKPGKPFYSPALAGLRFLTGWLKPLSYDYSESFRQSLPGALEKPPWSYRLAFRTTPTFAIGKTTRNASSNKSLSYKLGSGFGLLGGITTTVGFSRSIDEDVIVVGTTRSRKTSTSWPELSVSIQKFKVLPLLKGPVNWFIGIFAPRTGYSRQLTESRDIDKGFILSRSTVTNRNPLLSISFKVFSALSLSGSYGTGYTLDERFGATDGKLQQMTRSSRKSVTTSGKYSFSAPGGIGLPLFGKLKFKSTVSIDLSVKYDLTKSETSNDGGVTYSVGSDKSSFQVSPKIAYTFSRQIQGGLTARWQDTNDGQRGKSSHVREIQIWTEITF